MRFIREVRQGKLRAVRSCAFPRISSRIETRRFTLTFLRSFDTDVDSNDYNLVEDPASHGLDYSGKKPVAFDKPHHSAPAERASSKPASFCRPYFSAHCSSSISLLHTLSITCFSTRSAVPAR